MRDHVDATLAGAPEEGREPAALLLELGRALHSYGTPAHRLEAELAALARTLGVEAEFFSAPTAIFAQFGGPGGVARVEPSEVNLEKQTLLDEVAERVRHGALGLVVLFRARPGDAPWIVAAGAVAFYGARGGAQLLGPQLGVAAGALAVGAASNLYSRWANVPTAITLIPGIMLLVPGGLGFSSLSAMLEKDVVSGVETAFAALMVAVALVAGLLVANVLVPARKAL